MATQRVIAAHLVLSVVRIQQLQYAGVIEKDASLDSARLSYLRWLRERISSKSNSDINNERARLIHHQANLASLEEDVKQGKLIPADEIEKEWNSMTMAMRAKFLALPKKIAAVGCGINEYIEMEALIKGFVYEALDELALDNESTGE